MVTSVAVAVEQAVEEGFLFLVARGVCRPLHKADFHAASPAAVVLGEDLVAELLSGVRVLERIGGGAAAAARGVGRLLAGRFRLAPAGSQQSSREEDDEAGS